MLRSAASKVMWVGRATVFLIGLAVVLFLTLAIVAQAADAARVPALKKGVVNTVKSMTTLVGTLTDPILKLDNNGTGPALQLDVGSGEAPLVVNADAGTATNLEAAEAEHATKADFAGEADVAAEAKAADHANTADSARSANIAGDADTLDGQDSVFFLHKPVVRAEGLASFQSVPNTAPFNGNPVRLQFPTEHFDTDSMHSTTQDTERFTAPRAGYYWVSAGVEWEFSENGASGSRTLQIEYQPSNGNGRAYPVSEVPGSTVRIVQQGGQLLHLNVGDSVYARVFQTSGNTLSAHGTFFDAYWVSP